MLVILNYIKEKLQTTAGGTLVTPFLYIRFLGDGVKIEWKSNIIKYWTLTSVWTQIK